MEVHADEFPQANMTVIMPKLARLAFRNKDQFMNFASSLDTSGSGKMSFDDFRYVFYHTNLQSDKYLVCRLFSMMTCM